MTFFPVIRTIDDLYPVVKHYDEIRFKEAENGCTIAHYMIGNNELFSGINAPYTKECRGITFGPDGHILCRSIHKFFNVGERLDTQEEFLNWNKVSSIQDKRDGSSISPILLNDKIIFKSKKSFESDVAVRANLLYPEGTNEYALSYDLQRFGFTPTFEFTSPLNRIVLNYKDDSLVLLHVRDNVTGKYLNREKLQSLRDQYKIQIVDEYNLNDAKELKEKLKTGKDFEGYIFQFEDGEMVKMKSLWYLNLHRTCVFTTEYNVAEMVLSETLDDYKSYLTEVKAFETFEKVLEIEAKVTASLLLLQDEVEYIARRDKELSIKDFAIKNKDDKLFHLAMMVYKGKEPDYNKFYEKYLLDDNFERRQL